MDKIYLSLDLDYFDTLALEFKEIIQLEKEFLNRIFNLGVPVFITEHHHRLLERINQQEPYSKIINLDTHSDLITSTGGVEDIHQLTEINERIACWLNFYKYKGNCELEWIYADKKHSIKEKMGLIQWNDTICDWKETKKKSGFKKVSDKEIKIKDIPWESIAEVGISISKDFIRQEEILDYFTFATREVYTPINGFYNVFFDIPESNPEFR